MQRPFTSGSRQAPDPFDQFLEEHNFYRKHTARDASCLFRVISEQMYDTQLHHYAIRKRCVRYMRKNREVFQTLIDRDFDEYLDDMIKPKMYGTLIELQALSYIFKRNILLFEPFNLGNYFGGRCDFENVFRVFYTPERHFDSVFTLNDIKDAAICQSICYDILYKDLYKLPDVSYAVEHMLYAPTFDNEYRLESNDDGYCTRIQLADGRIFDFDLPQNTNCILENYKLCHFHYKNFTMDDIKQRTMKLSSATAPRLISSELSDYHHQHHHPQSRYKHQYQNAGEKGLCKTSADDGVSVTAESFLPNKYVSCVRQLLEEGITPFPYKVAKALDPNMYRNIEFDAWNEARKESKLQNWYNGDTNFKLIRYHQQTRVHKIFQVGAKCNVKLRKSENDLYTCHIQEIAVDKGYCIVFIEQLGEKRLVPYESLTPLPPEQFKPWTLPYRFQRHMQKYSSVRFTRHYNYRLTQGYCGSSGGGGGGGGVGGDASSAQFSSPSIKYEYNDLLASTTTADMLNDEHDIMVDNRKLARQCTAANNCYYKLKQYTHLENFRTHTVQYCTMPLTVEQNIEDVKPIMHRVENNTNNNNSTTSINNNDGVVAAAYHQNHHQHQQQMQSRRTSISSVAISEELNAAATTVTSSSNHDAFVAPMEQFGINSGGFGYMPEYQCFYSPIYQQLPPQYYGSPDQQQLQPAFGAGGGGLYCRGAAAGYDSFITPTNGNGVYYYNLYNNGCIANSPAVVVTSTTTTSAGAAMYPPPPPPTMMTYPINNLYIQGSGAVSGFSPQVQMPQTGAVDAYNNGIKTISSVPPPPPSSTNPFITVPPATNGNPITAVATTNTMMMSNTSATATTTTPSTRRPYISPQSTASAMLRVNYDARKSTRINGADLPADMPTLRYYFNLGIECYHHHHHHAKMAITKSEDGNHINAHLGENDLKELKYDDNHGNNGNNKNPFRSDYNNNNKRDYHTAGAAAASMHHVPRRFAARNFNNNNNNKDRYNNYNRNNSNGASNNLHSHNQNCTTGGNGSAAGTATTNAATQRNNNRNLDYNRNLVNTKNINSTTPNSSQHASSSSIGGASSTAIVGTEPQQKVVHDGGVGGGGCGYFIASDHNDAIQQAPPVILGYEPGGFNDVMTHNAFTYNGAVAQAPLIAYGYEGYENGDTSVAALAQHMGTTSNGGGGGGAAIAGSSVGGGNVYIQMPFTAATPYGVYTTATATTSAPPLQYPPPTPNGAGLAIHPTTGYAAAAAGAPYLGPSHAMPPPTMAATAAAAAAAMMHAPPPPPLPHMTATNGSTLTGAPPGGGNGVVAPMDNIQFQCMGYPPQAQFPFYCTTAPNLPAIGASPYVTGRCIPTSPGTQSQVPPPNYNGGGTQGYWCVQQRSQAPPPLTQVPQIQQLQQQQQQQQSPSTTTTTSTASLQSTPPLVTTSAPAAAAATATGVQSPHNDGVADSRAELTVTPETTIAPSSHDDDDVIVDVITTDSP